MQNTTHVRTLVLTEVVIGIKKNSYKISLFNTDYHLRKKANKWQESKKVQVVKGWLGKVGRCDIVIFFLLLFLEYFKE